MPVISWNCSTSETSSQILAFPGLVCVPTTYSTAFWSLLEAFSSLHVDSPDPCGSPLNGPEIANCSTALAWDSGTQSALVGWGEGVGGMPRRQVGCQDMRSGTVATSSVEANVRGLGVPQHTAAHRPEGQCGLGHISRESSAGHPGTVWVSHSGVSMWEGPSRRKDRHLSPRAQGHCTQQK